MADTPANREELLDVMQISPHLDKIVIKAILEAIEAAGCRVVPVELTEKMHEAFSAESDSECPCVRLYEKSETSMEDYIQWARKVASQDHAIMTAASPFRPTQKEKADG